MEDLKYNPDGTVDLKWYNSLPEEGKMILGGKWTAGQLADYRAKKSQLAPNEILDLELEEHIEDCIETDRIENEKFGTKEYFLGRREDGTFMVVAPYYDEFYSRVRHLYMEVEATRVSVNFTYISIDDEYDYKKISEEDYQTLYRKFEDASERICCLLNKDSRILDRQIMEGDYLWCYGGVMKIKTISYEKDEYWSADYYCDGGIIDIGDAVEGIPCNKGNLSLFNQTPDCPHLLITEEAFLKGFEIAKNALTEIRNILNHLGQSD